MKKYLLILLIILFLASIAYIVYVSRKAPSAPGIGLTPPTPNIPNYISGVLPITFNYDKNSFKFPDKLPFISISPKNISKDSAVQIAANLGFNDTPNEFDDVNEGTKYYWSNDTNSLIITPKTATVKYESTSFEVPVVNSKNLTDAQITNTAQAFISKAGIIDQGKIKSTSITPYSSSTDSEGFQKTTRELAQIFQVNFTYSVSDYQILTLDPSVPLISVRILPDGTVYSMEAILFDSATTGFTDYPLKTYDDVVSRSTDAKLISLSNDYINISDIKGSDVQSISIEKISLVYLLDSITSTSIQPVYLLEGPSQVLNSSANYASLYLPAVK